MYKPSDSTGNALDDFLYSRKAPAMANVEVKVEKTFNFTEENIRQILSEYLADKHSINVDPSSFKMKITDSTTTGYMDNEYVPAKLDGFSVTVPG
jgi:type I restriction-modification system DNA methylase subunit